MTSISKLTAAPLAISNELTAALGVLNFDFSLMKIEAPPEYKAVGAKLSASRRSAAEEGDLHVTARKLRSLFDRIIPEAPALTKAYGSRVSQIATSPEFDPKSAPESGPFAEHVGFDGSSIWAAATSGSSAIAIHLLGCMLARMWTAPQATSIWEELVMRRKQDIARVATSDPEDYHQHAALKMSISRSQLGDWDASARAWLRAADEVDRKKENKQKKLHLIVDNVRVPVNVKHRTYESVIHAWTTSMKTVDHLISGIPQSINDGSALLGLSAWHLYPDLIVLGSTATEVKNDDPLFSPEGVLTLGLSYVGRKKEETPQGGEDGIYWSLPLARLRFYGQPVQSSSALSINHARLTLSDLSMVALGSMFRSWGQSAGEASIFLRCFSTYWAALALGEDDNDSQQKKNPYGAVRITEDSWPAVLASTAESLLKGKGNDPEALKLFSLGKRRDLKFLVHGQQRPPTMFGLCKTSELLSLLRQEDDRIEVLRRTTAKLGVPVESLVIRYKKTDVFGRPGTDFHYATVLPVVTPNRKPTMVTLPTAENTLESTAGANQQSSDNPDNDDMKPRSHIRWLTTSKDVSSWRQTTREQCITVDSTILGPIEGGRSKKFFWIDAPWTFGKQKYDTVTVDEFFGQMAEFALFRGKVDRRKPREITGVGFDFLFGDPDTSAISCCGSEGGQSTRRA
jgi:hypothetical protein